MEFELEYSGPLDADGLFAFFAARAVPGIEQVEDGAYRRSLRVAGGAVLELRPVNGRVAGRLLGGRGGDLPAAIAATRRLLDLDADPAAIAAALGEDDLVGPLVRANPGRRLPGHADPLELAIRAVIGQQVSVAGARTIAGRLVTAHGAPLARPVGAVTHLFPSPGVLADLDPDSLPMPRARGRALVGLAAALAAGEVDLGPGAEPVEARAQLVELPGIGPWTAEYVAMRALGDRDAFLPTDLGVRRALERLGEDGSPRAAAALGERWRPYRAYALSHLWSTLN